jgi:hypothetical protein
MGVLAQIRVAQGAAFADAAVKARGSAARPSEARAPLREKVGAASFVERRYGRLYGDLAAASRDLASRSSNSAMSRSRK